jgi:hypothetical protein
VIGEFTVQSQLSGGIDREQTNYAISATDLTKTNAEKIRLIQTKLRRNEWYVRPTDYRWVNSTAI